MKKIFKTFKHLFAQNSITILTPEQQKEFTEKLFNAIFVDKDEAIIKKFHETFSR